MINFNSKITKSIIIAIFILSLTISIYIVPASAIVSESLSSENISQMFNQSNYEYYRLYVNNQFIYPSSTSFDQRSLYPYVPDNNTIDPDSVRQYWFGRQMNNSASSGFAFDSTYPNTSDYLYISFPVGIYNAESISLKFMLLARNLNGSPVFTNFQRMIANKYIVFGAYTKDGRYVDITPNVFEYTGFSQFGNYLESTGNVVTWNAKVFEININNLDVNTIYCNIFFQADLTVDWLNTFSFGVSTVDTVGSNSQLTDIQSSIDSVIEEIKNSADQQKILNDMLMTVSPEGQLIIDQVNSDVQDVEEGLDSIIQGITVPLPEPDELLPDHEDIMGQYMDSGGSEAVAAIITPMFDEKGPIFIMIFAVLSIALISYVLYGKKA